MCGCVKNKDTLKLWKGILVTSIQFRSLNDHINLYPAF